MSIEEIPVGLPANYNYILDEQMRTNQLLSNPQMDGSNYPSLNQPLSQNIQLIAQPPQPIPTEKPKPYVSKWQKLAELLNQDEDGKSDKAGQSSSGHNQIVDQNSGKRPDLIQQFYNQSQNNMYPNLQPGIPQRSLRDMHHDELTTAQKMQLQIEDNNQRIKEQQERMMNFVAPKTVGPKLPAPPGVEIEIPVAKPNNVEGVNNYVIHKIQPNDTLDRICIIYNVPKDAIRKANGGFTGDEIYMKRELIIPNSYGPIFRTGENKEVSEEQRKKDCIDLMNLHLKERFGNQKSFKAEAQYYLEITNYNFEKAIKEFEDDLKFEKEQESKFKKGKDNKVSALLYLKK